MNRKLIGALISVTLLSGCQSLQNSFTNDEGNSSKEQQTSEKQEEKNGQAADDVLTLPAQYFNQIVETGGKKVIQNSENTLVLVNKTYYLSDSYIPSDLVRANVHYSFGDEQIEKALLRQEAATALEQMFNGAQAEGIELYAVSGYRSYARQKVLFDAEVQQHGLEKAEEAVAIPGQSEHQTGLTMDISSRSVNLLLTQEYENTPEGKWLATNAHKYGFILRYPKGKENITGYKYEPWHFRYVGKEFAKTIYEKGLTLEEYFNVVKEI
ncbi:M15 family metallopeptidase [Bacillus massiliigorillae]|uniref:M15 family metallopeptidase n=1 Tax=Bacillus massiliigorillae TaxID=1243664 RepID=UPI0003AB0D80|nr:M15 family metallopeptidase [Bacillus massiliigorillae]